MLKRAGTPILRQVGTLNLAGRQPVMRFARIATGEGMVDRGRATLARRDFSALMESVRSAACLSTNGCNGACLKQTTCFMPWNYPKRLPALTLCLLSAVALAGCGQEPDTTRAATESNLMQTPGTGILPPADNNLGENGQTDPAGTSRPVGKLTRDQLTAAAQLSARYLELACDEEGKFVYCVNMNAHVVVVERYNIVRHAGAIYALAMYQERFPNQETLDAIRRSVTFLRGEMTPLDDPAGPHVVWSRPEINHTGSPLQVKLGAVGLGLVALSKSEQLLPGSVSKEELRGLAKFILWMQKKDGSFYSKYWPDERGRDDRWTSLYYPGEAALGLVSLYECDPQPQWLQGAADVLSYLARSRAGQPEVLPDHWALLATAQLWKHYDKIPNPPSKAMLLEHARQVCRSLLTEHPLLADDAALVGSFTGDGRTTPAATRMEGLLAALDFLPASDQALRSRIQVAGRETMELLLRAQVRDGEFAGAIPRAIMQLDEAKVGEADFNEKTTEVRIDYVQHSLSAMLHYLDKFFPRQASTSSP